MSRKCTALKNDGQPCQAWAVHSSQPALCRIHGERGSGERGSRDRGRGIRRKKQPGAEQASEDGAFVKMGSEEVASGEAASSQVTSKDTTAVQAEYSFYRSSYSLEEISDLVHNALDHTLDDEVGAVRVAVRRVMAQMQEELTPAEYARMASTIFAGANAIARLLKTNRDLAEEMVEVIEEASYESLDEQSKQYRAEL